MNPSPACDFPDLLEGLLDETATTGQLFLLSQLLQSNAGLRRQTRTHLMVAEALAAMAPHAEEWRDPWTPSEGGADLPI